MLVKDLIEELKKYPDYYPIGITFDCKGCEFDVLISEIKSVTCSSGNNFPQVEIEVE